MIVSMRTRLLLLGSTLTPIDVVIHRTMSLPHRRELHALADRLLSLNLGLVDMALFFGGIFCFIGFLVSILFDYFGFDWKSWLNKQN